MTHTTRRYGDQVHCSGCGLSWDANETGPVVCAPPARESKQSPTQISNAKRDSMKKLNNKKANIPPERWAALQEALKTNDWSKVY